MKKNNKNVSITIEKYVRNKKIYALLLYLYAAYKDLLKRMLGNDFKKFSEKYSFGIKNIIDLEILAEEISDGELSEYIQNILENPLQYLEKYINPDDLVEIKLKNVILNIDRIIRNMPKGTASEGLAQIIDTIVGYYKELLKTKQVEVSGLLDDVMEEEEEEETGEESTPDIEEEGE